MTTRLILSVFLFGVFGNAVAKSSSYSSSSICLPDCSSGSCVFDMNVRLTAGQLGYFEVKGCDGVNPTLGLEIGVTHTFLQHEYENYYHPVGFAYFPDGAHDGVDELQPDIAPPDSGSDCASSATCPSPMYFLNGEYLGSFSNDPDVLPATTNETDFGLDSYEPVFFYPFSQWVGFGEFSINLRFDQVYDKDIFYFCHIHQFMTGRIKLLQNGVPTQPDDDLPVIPYEYDVPSEYDVECGSFGMTDFQLPNPQCPDRFVCGAGSLGTFAHCIETQNCYMFIGMTTGAAAGSEVALFLHQMIPHHENAINMAKTLLKEAGLSCDTFVDSPDCVMYQIGLEIVSDQNFQVQLMRGLLEGYGFNATNDCVVPVSSRDQGGYSHYESRGLLKNEAEETLKITVRDDSATKFVRGGDKEERTLSESEDSNICISSTGTYTVRVDLYAGELGYYTFEECGDMINPTIGMEIGTTYVFEQFDRSNYYHPIGFAYFPDGAHAGLDELEPGILPYGSASDCASDLTCPAPMYFKDGKYLGNYSNIPEVLAASTDEEYFGLDDYEPLFYRPSHEWSGANFSVYLKFDVDDFASDLFYFCHIHQFMAGRIKLLKDGVPVTVDDVPEVPYTYDKPGKFDVKCGSFGLDNFQLPNPQCFEPFVCDVSSGNSNLELYAECIEAMNCHMLAGMTTKASSMSGVALFIHHMVPHHQNAVNMAKTTLKLGNYQCDDLTTFTNDCVLEQILREIVNSQNFQIQSMYKVLEAQGFPKTDDCIVKFNPVNNGDNDDDAVEESATDDHSNDDGSGDDESGRDDDESGSDDDESGSGDDDDESGSGDDESGSDDDEKESDDDESGSDDDESGSDDDSDGPCDDDESESSDDNSDDDSDGPCDDDESESSDDSSDDDEHSDDDGSTDDESNDDDSSTEHSSDDDVRRLGGSRK